MRPIVLPLLSLVLLVGRRASADIYLHSLRGSNNRLNEVTQQVNNQQRLFDSQNNANGGYGVGDNCVNSCSDGNGNYDSTKEGAGEGVMYFYVGSVLSIEWTNQHGLNNDKLRSSAVLQYMCDGHTSESGYDHASDPTGYMRDGSSTGTIGLDNPGDPTRGVNEPYAFYEDCTSRERNKGLFVAKEVGGGKQTAQFTRQNPNGQRHGLECPEERDYYPYWSPSVWRDVAVLTDNLDDCPTYQQESQNVKGKFVCVFSSKQTSQAAPISQDKCGEAGGEWVQRPSWNIPPPKCMLASPNRDNHLGNAAPLQDANGAMIQGVVHSNSFNWTVPSTPSDRCVLRIRYNITTTDANELIEQQNDPTVEVAGKQLRLALNREQFGRTFEDRSHVFRIVKRPQEVSDKKKIYNVNVRGKRGNIVQVYPSVEYDFVPNFLHINDNDYIHFQWTGSDANPKGNDGEGKRMTDRSNIVQLREYASNFPALSITSSQMTINGAAGVTPKASPVQLTEPLQDMFESVSPSLACTSIATGALSCDSFTDVLQHYAYLSQDVLGTCDGSTNDAQSVSNCKLLNKAPAYFDGGLVQIVKPGKYWYMSTRNNNFSNRSQKGSVQVDQYHAHVQDGLQAVKISLGFTIGLGILGALVAFVLSHSGQKFLRSYRWASVLVVKTSTVDETGYTPQDDGYTAAVAPSSPPQPNTLTRRSSGGIPHGALAAVSADASRAYYSESDTKTAINAGDRSLLPPPLIPCVQWVVFCVHMQLLFAIVHFVNPTWCIFDDIGQVGMDCGNRWLIGSLAALVFVMGALSLLLQMQRYWSSMHLASQLVYYALPLVYAAMAIASVSRLDAIEAKDEKLDSERELLLYTALLNLIEFTFASLAVTVTYKRFSALKKALPTELRDRGHDDLLTRGWASLGASLSSFVQTVNNQRLNLQDKRGYAFVLVLYSALNIFLLIGVNINVWNDLPDSGSYDGSMAGFRLAKSGGRLMSFNLGVVLPLTMAKAILTWLREKGARQFFPISKMRSFHKLVGTVVSVSAVVHTSGHYINYASLSDSSQAYGEDPMSVADYALGTLTGFTGNMMILILVPIVGFALEVVRKRVPFELFWFSHHLFILMFVLLLLHDDSFWLWFVIPGSLYVMERITRSLRTTKPISIVKMQKQKGDVLFVEMERDANFRFKAGQYVYISCPQISGLWHPFTISSAPEQQNITLHIKMVGDWTSKLGELCEKERKIEEHKSGGRYNIGCSTLFHPGSHERLQLVIDGPFGAPAQDYYKFHTVVLVGAGIGVTPFASILQSLIIRLRDPVFKALLHRDRFASQHDWLPGAVGFATRVVHFYWVVRDLDMYHWFHALVEELHQQAQADPEVVGRFKLHLFYTGKKQVDVRNVESQGISFHQGRPRWSFELEQIGYEYRNNTEPKSGIDGVGVYLCGPKPIKKDLSQVCQEQSKKVHGNVSTNFHFYAESF